MVLNVRDCAIVGCGRDWTSFCSRCWYCDWCRSSFDTSRCRMPSV